MNNKKIALVTGGIGGIGTEICKHLAQQGRLVIATHLPVEENIARAWQESQKQTGYDIELAAVDVGSFKSCAAMAQAIAERFGHISILVNCAGITRDIPLRKMEESEWSSVLSTNLDSVFNVTRQVINDMLTDGFGRIVNISSVNAQKGQFGQTNYSAAKAGMHGFTKALAQEVAKKGVTVNTVSPGYIATNLMNAIPEEILDKIISAIPVGRLGRPDEIARAVAFLCDDKSSFITGSDLSVNGGLYMH
ncbi:3-oxoacyl-(acyl-carrier-protein) reductase [Candidatus Methylobacter favarea]|uniref:3-oxoacyl-(Acyl-carrier-protein) reductase n=1 Tax=Candidatus Methylobacter favarea TaxID=2707345 RepID=A0A8S0X8M3_9GAMM|nr:acetoacetyl-CoA reductase [Candidatus Methylobacter favarea]CAA9891260.1 3-oxoacyl-(acyl-carrier-protein) reductase [Candidatus Methylobacter favarea]